MKKSVPIINALAEFFDSYLPTAKGLSQNTITSYQYAFQLLFEYLDDVKAIPPESVTFQTLSNGAVGEYLNWLESVRGCGARTRNQRLAAISSFAKYAMRHNLAEALTFGSEMMNLPKKQVRKTDNVVYFSLEETSVLLGMPNPRTKTGKRDMVLMSVLYASGARAQELCDLTENDVRFGEKTSLRLVGKGGKGRAVIIPDGCSLLLKNYLKGNQYSVEERDARLRHVFSSQTHEHMTVSCIEGIVKKHVCAAKEERPDLFRHGSYSPHSFRHSIAVHMLESGIPLPVIKNFLGHASIESTLIYATVTPELASRYLREKGFSAKMPKVEESHAASLPFLSKITKGRRQE
jgi:site-specific recombinase XerD